MTPPRPDWVVIGRSADSQSERTARTAEVWAGEGEPGLDALFYALSQVYRAISVYCGGMYARSLINKEQQS